MYEQERQKVEDVKQRFDHLVASLQLTQKAARLAQLEQATASPDFWNDPQRARSILQEIRSLRQLVDSCATMQRHITNTLGLIELAAAERDESLAPDIQKETAALVAAHQRFEFERTLSGELDNRNAYLAIHAGAGGTEACDWAAMLLRMYSRWCDAHGFSYSLVDALEGDEAGYKSATLYVVGPYAFGYLKAERGVHRLVRISPFDANKRRHTSFASVDVSAEIDDDIEIEINEKDLRIDTYRSSGAGGQHVNVTDSAVRITHLPTGIVVACQNERSQIKNRATALKMLRAKLYQLELERREKQAAADYAAKQKIEWGSQIRSYVLHPYNLVKDLRTGVETSNTNAVLDGELDPFIEAYLRQTAKPT
ncbi:MAG: peptide chain release factor 2 [bacterium]|nr:peptide chain release factor 2 [bacterium]